MLELTNRQLWQLAENSADSQEVSEAILLLENRGERGEKLLGLRRAAIQKRLDELTLDEQKDHALLPKISAVFFVLSSLFLASSFFIILYEQQLNYLLEIPKFIVAISFLLIVRGVFIYKTTLGIIWARYMMLYGSLLLYVLLFIVGYPDIFKFILLEDLYFGVTFIGHLLAEGLALFLIFKSR